ncbi:MFS transporter [Streptoalloteichus hindustanus]|uniref:Predicted arabinose efflux permease, MFS family n=1 Tax=Streptoalloteichus hindustanus TaxID=2017 RepID=A0A1M4VUJ3_STRHI|nr:MFS transporter [Streptoalloteichus hindustanus]SHE72639.1 Predicted arabinose efflux permease, MFS family [Streptoalloteichus hindustanus]
MLAVLALGTFAVGTDGFVLAGLLPAIAADLDVPVAVAGQFVTLFAVTYAISAPVVALVTARWDRRAVLFGAQVLFTVGMLLQALSDTVAVMAVGRVVAAVGASAYTPTAAAVAGALAPPERRGRALSTVVGGMTVATVLGVPVGVLLSQWGSWRTALLMVTALGVLATVGTAVVPPVRLPAVDLRTRLLVLRRPGVPSTLLVTMATMAAAFSVYTYIAELLSPVAAGGVLSLLLFVYGAAGVVGNAVAGRLTDRHGSRPVLLVALVSLTVMMALWPVGREHIALAPVLLALWGVFGWMFTIPQQHRLIESAPEAAPVALGWNSSALYAGTAAGSLLGGSVLDLAGPAWLGPCAALGSALALAVVLLVRPRPGRAGQPAPVASVASASRT